MRGRRLLPVLFVITAIARSASAGPAARVEWPANGHTYEVVFPPVTVTWAQAQDSCLARGGYLATLTSSAENDLVYDLVAPFATSVWLGGLQAPGSAEPDGGWGWVTSETFAYTNWHAGEPNNGNGGPSEERLVFYTTVSGVDNGWNDVPMDLLLTAYVMEKDTTPVRPASWGGIKALGRR